MILRSLRRFGRDESGPTAVEYAVMLALILVACISMILTFGGASQAFWQNSYETIEKAVTGGS